MSKILNGSKVMAMVPVKSIKKAEEFYSKTLGLKKAGQNSGGKG